MKREKRWRDGILFSRLILFYQEEDGIGERGEKERREGGRRGGGNRQQFILKSGLHLSGERQSERASDGGRRRGAILPPSLWTNTDQQSNTSHSDRLIERKE